MQGCRLWETDVYKRQLMPYPISLAHKLALQLTRVRKDGTLSYLRPDGKTQVSVEYDENGKPLRLEAVVLSTQHDDDVTQEQIHEDIKKYVFDPILPKELVDAQTKFFINPTGRFVIGGPHGDAGLTAVSYTHLWWDLCSENFWMCMRRGSIFCRLRFRTVFSILQSAIC